MGGLQHVSKVIKPANKKVKKQKPVVKVKKAKNVDGNATRRKAARLASKQLPLPLSESELNEADREDAVMEDLGELDWGELDSDDIYRDLGEDSTPEPDDTDSGR